MIIILAKAEAEIGDELEILSRVKQVLKDDPVVLRLFKDKQKDLSLIVASQNFFKFFDSFIIDLLKLFS